MARQEYRVFSLDLGTMQFEQMNGTWSAEEGAVQTAMEVSKADTTIAFVQRYTTNDDLTVSLTVIARFINGEWLMRELFKMPS